MILTKYHQGLFCLTIFLLVFTLAVILPARAYAYCVSLTPSVNSVKVVSGQNTTVSISIATAVNFNYGTEKFSVTGLPTDAKATFMPSNIPYSNGYSGTTMMTIETSNNTPEGTNPITIHLVGSGPDAFPGNVAKLNLSVISHPAPPSISPQAKPTSNQAVPEFGLVTPIVLLISITSIIAFSFKNNLMGI